MAKKATKRRVAKKTAKRPAKKRVGEEGNEEAGCQEDREAPGEEAARSVAKKATKKRVARKTAKRPAKKRVAKKASEEAGSEEDREAAGEEACGQEEGGSQARQEARRQEDRETAREEAGEASGEEARDAESYEAPLTETSWSSASFISFVPNAVSRRATIVPAPSIVKSHGSLGSDHAVTVGDSAVPEVLVDLDVDERDVRFVRLLDREQLVEHRPAVLRGTERGGREQRGDRSARRRRRPTATRCAAGTADARADRLDAEGVGLGR